MIMKLIVHGICNYISSLDLLANFLFARIIHFFFFFFSPQVVRSQCQSVTQWTVLKSSAKARA